MSIFSKKEKAVEKLTLEHLDAVQKTIENVKPLFENYMASDKAFKDDAYNVHNKEHEADIIRRKVEQKLNEGAFLSVYREDYINLLELVDKIANSCETLCDFIVLTRPVIPDNLKEGVLIIINESLRAYDTLKKAVVAFQESADDIGLLVQDVNAIEQAVDKIEWQLTNSLFKADIELAVKLHLRELIIMLANITDRMEDVGDRLDLMVAKRNM